MSIKQPTLDNGKWLAQEWKIKQRMSPVQISEKTISFRHHIFPKIEIFVIFRHPKIDDLKKIKMSKLEIGKYISHKHYNSDYDGRCFYDEKMKRIIVSVTGFHLYIPKTIGTLAHEMNHAAHRLFESINHNFSEEGLCTLMGELTEIALTPPGTVQMQKNDLVWNHIMIMSEKIPRS